MPKKHYSTKELCNMTDDELIALKNKKCGSYETRNPKSESSLLISLINGILFWRKRSTPARNTCWGSNHGGKPTGN